MGGLPASKRDGCSGANYNAAYACIKQIYAITHWHAPQSSLPTVWKPHGNGRKKAGRQTHKRLQCCCYVSCLVPASFDSHL